MIRDLNWDYRGWVNKDCYFGGNQDAWNQTLITKINELSAQMHRMTLGGGATLLEVGANLEPLFETLEYYHRDTQTLGYRYEIIFRDEMCNTIRVSQQSKNEARLHIRNNGPIFDRYDELTQLPENGKQPLGKRYLLIRGR